MLGIFLCENFSHVVFKKTLVQNGFSKFSFIFLNNSTKQKLLPKLCFATQLLFKNRTTHGFLITENTIFITKFHQNSLSWSSAAERINFFSSLKHTQFVSISRWRIINYVFVFVSRFGTTVHLVLIRLTTAHRVTCLFLLCTSFWIMFSLVFPFSQSSWAIGDVYAFIFYNNLSIFNCDKFVEQKPSEFDLCSCVLFSSKTEVPSSISEFFPKLPIIRQANFPRWSRFLEAPWVEGHI